MRVEFRDGMYRGTHITGPTHNYLAMTLNTDGGVGEVVVMPPIGACAHHEGLKAAEVVAWISEGIDAANRALGTHYSVGRAEIVENDSRRPEVYAELARRIVLAAHES